METDLIVNEDNYNLKKTSLEKELQEIAKQVLPGGVVGMSALPGKMIFIPAYGKGSKIFDVSGNEYIDYHCGSGPIILGHNFSPLTQAIKEQMEKGSHFSTVLNEPIIRLAEKIVQVIPGAEKVRFGLSGTDGTLYAIRLARALYKKEKILKFEGAYHGYHDYALISNHRTKKLYDFPQPEPASAGIPEGVINSVLVAPFNNIEITESIIKKYKDELAAVIVEPYQRSIKPKPGFLKDLRTVTDKYGICLIFDEVVTGFRMALGGAQEFYGVQADVTVVGKGLGNGYPVSAVCGSSKMLEHYNPTTGTSDYAFQTGTLNGNPISAVAGLTVIQALQKPGIYERWRRISENLRQGLREIFKKYGVACQVLGDDAPFWHTEFTDREIVDFRSSLTADKNKLLKFECELVKHNIFVVPGNGKKYISAVHTDEDIRKTLEICDKIISKF